MDRVSGLARGDSSDVHNWVFANFLFCVDLDGSNRMDLMAAGGRRGPAGAGGIKRRIWSLIYKRKGKL